MHTARRAFTLLELVVGFIIMAILAAITIPVFVQLASKSSKGAKGHAGTTLATTTTVAHTTTTLAKGGGELAAGQVNDALSHAMGIIFVIGAIFIGVAFLVGLIKFISRGATRVSSYTRDIDEMHKNLSEMKQAVGAKQGDVVATGGGASMGVGSTTHQSGMVSGGQGAHQDGVTTLSGQSAHTAATAMVTSSLDTMAPDPAHSGAIATLEEPAPLVHAFVGPVTKKNRRERNSGQPKFR